MVTSGPDDTDMPILVRNELVYAQHVVLQRRRRRRRRCPAVVLGQIQPGPPRGRRDPRQWLVETRLPLQEGRRFIVRRCGWRSRCWHHGIGSRRRRRADPRTVGPGPVEGRDRAEGRRRARRPRRRRHTRHHGRRVHLHHQGGVRAARGPGPRRVVVVVVGGRDEPKVLVEAILGGAVRGELGGRAAPLLVVEFVGAGQPVLWIPDQTWEVAGKEGLDGGYRGTNLCAGADIISTSMTNRTSDDD